MTSPPTTMRISFFVILAVLLLVQYASAASHLRKRVENKSSEEFGRTLKTHREKHHAAASAKTHRRSPAAFKVADLEDGHDGSAAKHHEPPMEADIDEMLNERMLIMSMSMSLPETPAPTPEPTFPQAETYPPTKSPTPAPVVAPTPLPTVYVAPSAGPTPQPTAQPTAAPTPAPVTPEPTLPQAETYPPTPQPTQTNRYPTTDAGGPTDEGAVEQPAVDVRVLSVQEEEGVCSGPSNGVGCASESQEMQGGNPNDIVNCFDVSSVGLSTPFELTGIRFWMGDSTLPPADLSIQVWSGTVTSGPSDTNLYSQELSGYVSGKNSVDLPTALSISSSEFCVGVKSESMTDGLRIQTDGGTTDSASYLKSPRCGLPAFRSLNEIAGPGDFCIEALVTESAATR